MADLTASVEQAAAWAVRGSTPSQDWNPVYRALSSGSFAAPLNAPAAGAVELVSRQFGARALLVVAVTRAGATRRMRIGLDPAGATVESGAGDAPSQWSPMPTARVPAAITELLEVSGADAAPARASVVREAEGLRLTPAQNEQARAALVRGASPQEAYAAVPDLDERLRDALTARGPRISVSLTLHDPSGAVTERPVSFSRLWVTGRRGRYRTDSPGSGGGAIHAVEAGDVLGTVLPLVEEGLRFAAACAAGSGAS